MPWKCIALIDKGGTDCFFSTSVFAFLLIAVYFLIFADVKRCKQLFFLFLQLSLFDLNLGSNVSASSRLFESISSVLSEGHRRK